jgi:hypothetical protein
LLDHYLGVVDAVDASIGDVAGEFGDKKAGAEAHFEDSFGGLDIEQGDHPCVALPV